MVNVRKAQEADLPALLAMCAAMHAESPRFRDLDYSEEKMFYVLTRIMASPDQGGVLVAEQEGALIGMLGFLVVEHFFGREALASDLGIYVAPAARGSSAFLRLVRAFEAWADSLGVREKQLGVNTGVHIEQTAAALERLGYERCGINLLKRVSNV